MAGAALGETVIEAERAVRLSGTENRHKATYGSMTRQIVAG